MTDQSALTVQEPRAIERVREQLELRMDKIDELLPPTMDARRFTSVSLMAVSKHPGLLECDPTSIVLAILEAAEIGLEPTGGIGGAHLVPFRKDGVKRAQLIYDYRGIQYLIREGGGGEVKTVLVYEGDIFRVYEGTERPRIVHTRKFVDDSPTKVTYVYAVPEDHPTKFEVMTRAQVEAVRARSKSPNNGPWVTDWGPQARKTVLKRISAWLPLKPSARAAIERDTERDLNDGDSEPSERRSRTAQVRDDLLSRAPAARRRKPATDAPGAPEAVPVAPEPAPAVSADQQTPTEGEVRDAECGERLVPVEGPVESCVLPPDHTGESHRSASGKRWPAA